jgi:hypothetical protein
MTYILKKFFSLIFFITFLLTGWMDTLPANCQEANDESIYSGTFNGEQNGAWFLRIDNSGKGQIYFWLTASQVVDSGEIKFNSENKFQYTCTYGLSGSGGIHSDGTIKGNWKSEENSGAMIGSRQDPAKIEALAGTYSGRSSGNEIGSWNLTLSKDGSISGTITWEKNRLVEKGSGVVNSNGDFIFLTEDDTSAYGSIDPSGNIHGNWNNPFWETSGTLGNTAHSSNSNKTTSTDKQKMPVYVESENDNGCFIQMVIP